MVKLSAIELERKSVRERLETLTQGSWELCHLHSQYGDSSIVIETDYDYSGEYTHVYLVKERLENDEEYNHRIASLTASKEKEAARKKAALEKKKSQELREFNRIKKKYKL
jgi:hypothetical protein